MNEVLAASSLHKTYRLGRVAVPVLRGTDISIREGEWVAILGASGSGKSTLLHLLGGLDRPDRGRSGSIVFQGRPLASMSPRELDRYRASSVGFVFQFYHLLPELNVLENVLVAAMVRHGRFDYTRRRAALRSRAKSILETLGLSKRLTHRPVELSGGERQRVAIARGLINEPAVLLADEPTGNLDRKTGDGVLDAIAALKATRPLTILMVTHDTQVASRADRIVHLRDGLVVPGNGAPSPVQAA